MAIGSSYHDARKGFRPPICNDRSYSMIMYLLFWFCWWLIHGKRKEKKTKQNKENITLYKIFICSITSFSSLLSSSLFVVVSRISYVLITNDGNQFLQTRLMLRRPFVSELLSTLITIKHMEKRKIQR